jgi:hypothetical protein
MFLNYGSITRPPPSLFPGSDGTRSPGFNRYYEAAKTTGRIGRHSVCHVVPPYLGLISSVCSPSRGNRRADARVLFDRSHPLFPVFCPKDAVGSPKFPVNPFDLCHALRPRSAPDARSSSGVRIWSPSLKQRRRRRFMSFAARSPGFSHRCLRFVPPSRTTTQNSLPVADRPSGWAFPCPQSSFGEFHTFALPSPRTSLGAIQFSIMPSSKLRSFGVAVYQLIQI